MNDIEIKCKECSIYFYWTVKEQEWMKECFDKQTANPYNGSIIKKITAPVRCHDCRIKRKSFFNQKSKE